MNLQFKYLCIPDTHMSYAPFRFLAFSLSLSNTRTHTHIHSLTHQNPPADCKYDYVRKYVRKKLSGSGMCIRTYASGTYIQQYATSLNHPSSDTIVEQRKEGKKKNNGKWRKGKGKKKTMPSRRIKSLEKKLSFTMSILYLEGTCMCILYTVLYLIAMT